MQNSRGFVFVTSVVLFACEPPFPPPSEVENLRVLASRSVPASGSPGTTVALDLLIADGSEDPESVTPRPLEIAWLGGCHNPPTRQFFACYPYLQTLARNAPARLRDLDPATLPAGVLGFGANFELPVPDDILSAAPRVPSDPVHFGVSYAFFAVCAGEIRTKPELDDRVPLVCVDEADETPLGHGDFITGFATVFSYEGAVNENPTLDRIAFDGVTTEDAECIGDADCESLASGERSFVCGPRSRCVRHVLPCEAGAERCPPLRVAPEIARFSAETLPTGENEIVWARFYATGGRFDSAAQLVNDRNVGWIDGASSNWRAPRSEAGLIRFWVTLHDQRGGTDYQSFDVFVGER
jgi:hypothetical protein